MEKSKKIHIKKRNLALFFIKEKKDKPVLINTQALYVNRFYLGNTVMKLKMKFKNENSECLIEKCIASLSTAHIVISSVE